MNMKVCSKCKGRRKIVGMGHMETDCLVCDKTGFVKVKPKDITKTNAYKSGKRRFRELAQSRKGYRTLNERNTVVLSDKSTV